MAFRYLIYRTDFGDTIVRESATSGTTTGGTELELFTDFVIPEIQPLYFWRVTGATDVIENLESNVQDWYEYENPLSPYDPVPWGVFTGYTGSTDVRITNIEGDIVTLSGDVENKIDKVTGATGNLGQFTADGNLEDTGWQISGLTGGSDTDVYVSGMTYIGSTLTLKRTEGFPDLTTTIVSSGASDGVVSGATLSGQTLHLERTEGLPDVTVDLGPLLSDVEADIITLSGDVAQNTSDIITLSGQVVQNTTDIATLSGITDTKLDESVFTGYTATTDVRLEAIEDVTDIAITGVTNGLTKVGSHDAKLGGALTEDTIITGNGFDVSLLNLDQFILSFSGISTITDSGSGFGLQYAADYSATFIDRSLVDKAYVDAVAAGADWKESCRVATTTGETDIDLTGGTFAGVVDGYALQDGDRVLIKNQDSTQEYNGIYNWSASTSGFTRSEDFDGTPTGEVTAGATSFVEMGNINSGTTWILVTNDPITIDVTPLVFSLSSYSNGYQAGTGIIITGNVISFDGASVAGDNLSWSGTQLDVFGLVDIDTFTGYTASTDIRITSIETDITTLSGQVTTNTNNITTLSGDVTTNTNNIITLSGDVTTNTNNIITLSGDVENLYTIISGLTGASYVTTDEFTGYTASTDVRITNIESDITTLSGDVITLSGEVANKIDKVTGATGNLGQFTVDGNLEDTGYQISALTATTANEIQLVSSAATEVNTITATAIDWHIVDYSGSSYLFSGGSSIYILETDDYEVSYSMTVTQTSGGQDKSVGSYIILNNAETLDRTSSAGSMSGSDMTDGLSIPSTIFNFTAGDYLDLAAFRIGGAGSAETNPYETVLKIKRKGTLV